MRLFVWKPAMISVTLLALGVFSACAARPELDSSGSVVSASLASAPTQSKPEIKPSQHYLQLVSQKQELLSIVHTRVEEYRTGLRDPLSGHHVPYPASFPDPKSLPLIVSNEQFAVRQEPETDALGSIYLAVRIDDAHELRMDVSQSQNSDGQLVWGSGNSWFSLEGDPQHESWALSDIDLSDQGDEKIYQIALRTYGAEDAVQDDLPILRPTMISLFYSTDGWSGSIDTRLAFSWFFSTTFLQEYDYKLTAYQNPAGEEQGWFFPQDIYEPQVQRFFDVSTEQLRSDPLYYNAALGGYVISAGGGRGEQPPIILTKTQKNGDLHQLYYTIEYQGLEKVSMVMTIRILPDSSFRFVSVLPA